MADQGNVTALRPCVCGKPGTRRAFDYEGDTMAFMACDECFGTSVSFLDRVRPVFAAMRDVGIPRDIANEAMTFLLDKIDDTDKLVPTALDIIRKANERGEVGFAETPPGKEPKEGYDADSDAFDDAIDRGWLVYGYDASPDIFSVNHGQKRTVYVLTAAGRQALAEAAGH